MRWITAALVLTATIASADRRNKWRVPSEAGRLRNLAQNMCLDVAGWNAQGDGNVLLWECNNDPDQTWTWTASGELRNAVDGRCLDIAGRDGARGANVGVYACENLDDQRWAAAMRGGEVFELRSKRSGVCLDVKGKAGARGDDVMVWSCDNGTDQLWRWEPLAVVPPPRRMPPELPPPEMLPTQPPPKHIRHEVPPPPRVQPPPAYPPPPPAPPPPMSEGNFRQLLQAIANEGFSDGKVRVIQQAASSNLFRVAQLKQVVLALSFSADKLKAVEAIGPRLVDRQNLFTLYDAFSFSADKERARQILEGR